MRHLLPFLLLAALLVGCASTKEAPTLPPSVSTSEKAGPVFDEEKQLLSELKKRGIMIPDSISVVEGEKIHGYVRRIQAPRTIHLTTAREAYPKHGTSDSFPYLYGRTKTPDEKIFRAWVVSHELAHLQGPRLNAEMGRPALGVDVRTQEVQADILALVLMKAVYGVTREDLGYPASIDYPFIPDKSVPALRRQYCYIVNRTWQAQLDCK